MRCGTLLTVGTAAGGVDTLEPGESDRPHHHPRGSRATDSRNSGEDYWHRAHRATSCSSRHVHGAADPRHATIPSLLLALHPTAARWPPGARVAFDGAWHLRRTDVCGLYGMHRAQEVHGAPGWRDILSESVWVPLRVADSAPQGGGCHAHTHRLGMSRTTAGEGSLLFLWARRVRLNRSSRGD